MHGPMYIKFISYAFEFRVDLQTLLVGFHFDCHTILILFIIAVKNVLLQVQTEYFLPNHTTDITVHKGDIWSTVIVP
jgi:hypothetical protein